MIAGDGIPIDAVVSDFVAGAAEALSPGNDQDHWDVIEGQGSLFHPAYAGVSLGLLHGSQPDIIVMCHDPSRRNIYGYPDYPIPDLGAAIEVNLQMGRMTNPNIRCAGVSVNTKHLTNKERNALFEGIQRSLSIPAFDPIATGADAFVEYILS